MSGAVVDQLRELLESSPDGLSRLVEWKQQYRGRHEGVEGQLRASVQSKLDEMHEAVQLLREAKGELQALRGNMQRIDLNCNKAKSKLASEEFEEIRSLSNARVNLTQVINELDDFLGFPARVKALGELLGDSTDAAPEVLTGDEVPPQTLRKVFSEWFTLNEWQQNILQEIMGSESGGNTERSDTAWASSAQAQARTLQILGGHFEDIDKLGDRLWDHVWARIRNCLSIAQFAPEQLVVAFEIIVRADKMAAAGEGSSDLGYTATAAGTNEGDRRIWQHRCQQLLDEVVQKRLDSVIPQLNNSANNVDRIEQGNSVINATTVLLMDLSIVHEDVSKCCPPWLEILQQFQTQYHDRIWLAAKPSIEHTLFLADQLVGDKAEDLKNDIETTNPNAEEENAEEDESSETVGALVLRWISWTEQYRTHMVSELGFDSQLFQSVDETSLLLINAYIQQAMPRLRKWMRNITQNRSNKPHQDGHGALVTTVPEDLFNMLSNDLEVVIQQVSVPQHVVTFCCNCVFVLLNEVQQQQQARLSNSLAPGDVSLEELCAIVNDSERIQEHCDGLASLCKRQQGISEEDQILLNDALDNLVSQFIRTATEAVEVIGIHIMFDLDGVISELFTPAWEQGTAGCAAVICATLGEYLEDKRNGMVILLHSSYFLGKLVASLLNQVVCSYIGELLRPASRPPPENVYRAVTQLRSDRQQFEDYFETHLQVLCFGGIRSQDSLKESLGVIELIASFLESKMPQVYVEELSNEFGPYAELAIDRLVLMHHRGQQVVGPAVHAALKVQSTSDGATENFEQNAPPRESRYDAVAVSWGVGPLADQSSGSRKASLFSKLKNKIGKQSDKNALTSGSRKLSLLAKLAVQTVKEERKELQQRSTRR